MNRRDDQAGSVAVIVAIMMVLFLSILAAVVDLGQVYTARVILASGTDAAVLEAAQILSQDGCLAFNTARTAASENLADRAPTATLESFTVTYSTGVVDDVTDCVLLAALGTDEKVGRVDLDTRDTRPYAFATFFSDDDEGVTTAAAGAQWGYVKSFAGRVRPLSLCAQNQGYLDYQQYLADREAYLLDQLLPPLLRLGLLPPDPTLLDPFDVEIDGYQASPCQDPAVAQDTYGEFVIVDFFGDGGPATKDELRQWVERGAPDSVTLDDPGTGVDEAFCPGEDPDKLGACEGVTQSQSLDVVSDFLPVLGKTFTIMIHDRPECDNGQVPPDHGHCTGNSGDARGHRVYPVTSVARVRVLCLRISAPDAASSPISAADGANCTLPAMPFTTLDGNTGDDVIVRLQFVLDSTIQESNLSSDPVFDRGFLGMNLCRSDDNDECGF